MYISECGKCYNDLPVNYDEQHKQMLLDAGMSVCTTVLTFSNVGK